MYDGRSFIVEIPCIIKSHTAKDGKRIVEVQASDESIDGEGDLIMQKALLDAAPDFIRSGHCDIDHISELGYRMGIANPLSYIIGRPTEVKDYGKGCTGVVAEIMKSADGKHDPVKNKYDEFWDSLNTTPPMKWSASIYGFPKPGEIIDCRTEVCDTPARRFVVKGIDWRSMAFTTKPINDNLTRYARVVTAKAFIELLKGASPLMPVTTVGLSDANRMGDTYPPVLPDQPLSPYHQDQPSGAPATGIGLSMAVPRNLSEAVGQYHCHMKTGACEHTGGLNSRVGFKNHFLKCCGASDDMADLLSHSLLYHLLLEKKRGN